MATKALKESEANVLAIAEMYEEDAGAGFENFDSDSIKIPFLVILQDLSPQVKKSNPKYLEDAEVGMIFDSVREILYPGEDGIEVVPCGYKRSFIEWKPDRGGFVVEHPIYEGLALLRTCVRNERNQDILPNGNQLADTRTHFVLARGSDGSFTPAAVSMASSQIKNSKLWNARMDDIKFPSKSGRKYTPPMYAHVWRLTTAVEKKGENEWYGWKFALVNRVDDPELHAEAKRFCQLTRTDELELNHAGFEDDEPPY